jgi:hypothetical protein
VQRSGIGQVTMLAVLAWCVAVAPARADWLVVPYAGTAFGAETSLITLEAGSARTVVGVSGAWLSDQLIGVEADLFYGPSFFGNTGLAVDSSLTTLSGGAIIAVPLSITRESLRPYITGGLGLVHEQIDYSLEFLGEARTTPAMHLGGGAIGFVGRRTGYRFDLRHVRSLSREDDRLTGTRRAKLGFWRLTIGIVIRVG